GLQHGGIAGSLVAGNHRFSLAPETRWPDVSVGQKVECVMEWQNGQWVVAQLNPTQRAATKEAGPKKPDPLAVNQKGMSDGMDIEVSDVAKNKFGKLEIAVRITNRSETLRKRPYFYFSLSDEFGNQCGIAPGNANASLDPGKSLQERHSFDMPVEKAQHGILAVSNRDGKHFDVIRFKIPKSIWTAAAAKAQPDQPASAKAQPSDRPFDAANIWNFLAVSSDF